MGGSKPEQDPEYDELLRWWRRKVKRESEARSKIRKALPHVLVLAIAIVLTFVLVPNGCNRYERQIVDFTVVEGPYGLPSPGPGPLPALVCVEKDPRIPTKVLVAGGIFGAITLLNRHGF